MSGNPVTSLKKALPPGFAPTPVHDVPYPAGKSALTASGNVKKRKRAKKTPAKAGKPKAAASSLIKASRKLAGPLLDEVAPENETAEEKRLRRNRINDRRKRARRAMKVEFLNEQFETLTKQNEDMRAENKTLREQIATVRKLQGLGEAKVEPPSSVEEPRERQTDVLAKAGCRSRLDGTILQALNREITQKVPTDTKREAKSATPPPQKPPADSRCTPSHSSPAEDKKPPAKTRRPPRQSSPPSTEAPPTASRGEENVATVPPVLEEKSIADQMLALALLKQQQGQGGAVPAQSLLRSVQQGTAGMDQSSLRQQTQRESVNQDAAENLVLSTLLQNQRSAPRTLQAPSAGQGSDVFKSYLLQRHQQENQAPGARDTLSLLRQQSQRDDLGRNQLLQLLQQQNQDRTYSERASVLASLQHQNQASVIARNQLLAPLQRQQQSAIPSDVQLLSLLRQHQQAPNRSDQEFLMALQAQGSSNTAGQDLLASLSQQQQAPSPSEHDILMALQSHNSGQGAPQEALACLLQQRGENQTGGLLSSLQQGRTANQARATITSLLQQPKSGHVSAGMFQERGQDPTRLTQTLHQDFVGGKKANQDISAGLQQQMRGESTAGSALAGSNVHRLFHQASGPNGILQLARNQSLLGQHNLSSMATTSQSRASAVQSLMEQAKSETQLPSNASLSKPARRGSVPSSDHASLLLTSSALTADMSSLIQGSKLRRLQGSPLQAPATSISSTSARDSQLMRAKLHEHQDTSRRPSDLNATRRGSPEQAPPIFASQQLQQQQSDLSQLLAAPAVSTGKKSRSTKRKR